MASRLIEWDGMGCSLVSLPKKSEVLELKDEILATSEQIQNDLFHLLDHTTEETKDSVRKIMIKNIKKLLSRLRNKELTIIVAKE